MANNEIRKPCRVDFTQLEFMYDGHLFKETEFKGIYECQDDFPFNEDKWANDESNYDLAVLCYNIPYQYDKTFIKYLMHRENMLYQELQKKQLSMGRRYSRLSCTHYYFPFESMGGLYNVKF